MKEAQPPGPKGHFLLGSMPRLQHDRLGLMIENFETYGDIIYMRGPRRIYQINHPDMIQYVLVKGADKFHKSPMLKKVTEPVLGKGLLTSDGDFHRQQRRLVQPAFHHNRIANYAGVMVDYTARMLDSWRQGDQRDIHHEMMNLTMQIVAKTLFDADVSEDAESIGHAISFAVADASVNMTRVLRLPEWVPTALNRKRRQTRAAMERTIMGTIEERRRTGEDKGDLLSMLLLAQDEDSGARMSDRQVHDEAMTLFIAGHETTANALTWTLYLLSQHPEVQAKLLAEIDAVLGGRLPVMGDLKALTYTDMVIKEAMRLYPPAWVVARYAIEDVMLGGYRIPAGSIIMMSQYVMHRHPDYWDAPETFDPERFGPGREERVPRYAYFPFGGGPRVCIGNSFAAMEASLVLATMIQRCTLDLVPGQTVEMEPLITLRPKGAMRMIVRERTIETAQKSATP